MSTASILTNTKMWDPASLDTGYNFGTTLYNLGLASNHGQYLKKVRGVTVEVYPWYDKSDEDDGSC